MLYDLCALKGGIFSVIFLGLVAVVVFSIHRQHFFSCGFCCLFDVDVYLLESQITHTHTYEDRSSTPTFPMNAVFFLVVPILMRRRLYN